MKSQTGSLIHTLLGAAAVGAFLGMSEAIGVAWLGRLWLPNPAALLVLTAGVVAALSAPMGLLAKGRTLPAGIGLGAVGWGLLNGVLAVITDPPPFQSPPWYSGSVLAGLALVALVGLAVFALRRLPNLGWVGLLAVPWAALVHYNPGAQGSGDRGAAASAPNLLIVTLDTTRADHMGAYGYERDTSPVFDALAREGVLFQAAIAPIAVTGPSHTSLHTGSGTWSHNTLLNGIPMPAGRPTIASSLQDEGYATGAFVSAYVLDGKYGFSQGFATYDDDYSVVPGWDRSLPGRLQAGLVRRFKPNQVLERRGDDTVDHALDWLDNQQGPWFLWVHLFDAHGPYEPPAPYDTRYYSGDPMDPSNESMAQVQNVAPYLVDSLNGITDVDYVVAQYDGEIAFADAQLGRLLEGVESRGESTLILVNADHGEALGEQGVWFNHGDDLFDASTHIPAAMRFDGVIPPGTQVHGLVEVSDFAPTVYGLLGVQAPSEVEGMDLSTDWQGRTQARGLAFDREANLAAREKDPTQRPTLRLAGLRSASSLFIRRESLEFSDALYRSDMEGSCTLCPVSDLSQAQEFPMEVQTLAQQADDLLNGDADRSAAELTSEERAMLEALGYME
ncbi:MAG: arylsulfatase A-like enzyme [Cognaticolwellia sp.]|jgi:arylsulfatase A-like enzyme